LFGGRDLTGRRKVELFLLGLVRIFQISQEFSRMTVLESLLVVPSVQGRCSYAGLQWPGSLPKAIPMQLRSLLTFCGALLCLFAIGCAPKNYGDYQYQLRMAAAGKDIMWVTSKLEIDVGSLELPTLWYQAPQLID